MLARGWPGQIILLTLCDSVPEELVEEGDLFVVFIGLLLFSMGSIVVSGVVTSKILGQRGQVAGKVLVSSNHQVRLCHGSCAGSKGDMKGPGSDYKLLNGWLSRQGNEAQAYPITTAASITAPRMTRKHLCVLQQVQLNSKLYKHFVDVGCPGYQSLTLCPTYAPACGRGLGPSIGSRSPGHSKWKE